MNRDMAPEEIKRLIYKAGQTVTGLATAGGFSPPAVTIALKRRSPFVQQYVADFLNLSPQEIWPSRYDVNGSPIRMDSRGRQIGATVSNKNYKIMPTNIRNSVSALKQAKELKVFGDLVEASDE